MSQNSVSIFNYIYTYEHFLCCMNVDLVPIYLPSIEGTYRSLVEKQSDVEYCQGDVNPTDSDIHHVLPVTPDKKLWKIIVSSVLARKFSLFKARLARKRSNLNLKNGTIYIDIYFTYINSQGITRGKGINRTILHTIKIVWAF